MSELHSVVVPVFNEAEGIREFHRRVTGALSELPSFEILYVNDGSRDASGVILAEMAAADERVKVVTFARNFGHQTAITAGIDMAAGDTVTVIDADLQDPPEVIPQLVEEWRAGADVVFAVRASRAGESAFKKVTASLFYRILRSLAEVDIPLDAGDFRLMSRRAAESLKGMRERSRYIRGLVAWLGLPSAYVEYERDARFAGETKYPLRKMLRLALDGLVSFSTRPLQLASVMGFVVSGLSMLYGIVVVLQRLLGDRPVEGWSSLMVVLLFLGGVQLITLGIVGEYVGRIYDEVRRRPLYLIRDVTNFAPSEMRRFALTATQPADEIESAEKIPAS